MIAANANAPAAPDGRATVHEYVTVMVADQMFGLPIDRVHDVFAAAAITQVPLAPDEIAGLINLRGRVVTALCLRRRLGLPDGESCDLTMAVGLDHQGEAYGLLVDGVGEVLRLAGEAPEANPVHMDKRWAQVSRGVHRLDDKLLIILDVDAVLSFEIGALAA